MSNFSDQIKQSDSVEIKLGTPEKTPKVFVGINTLANLDQWVYANHMPFFFDLGRMREQMGIKFVLFAPPRMSIDKMRNESARIAMEQDCTHLMFVDDDVLLPEDSLRRLLAHKKDIVGGLTYIRSYPFDPMIFDFKRDKDTYHMRDFKDKIDPSNGLVPCDALGFSCVLISLELIKKIPPPYFVTGVNHTEDVYFCKKAVEYFPETKIWIDPTIHTSHKIGSEFVDDENIEFWRDYYEKFHPKEIDAVDRGDDYIKQNEINTELTQEV
jgi:hypothetical protein